MVGRVQLANLYYLDLFIGLTALVASTAPFFIATRQSGLWNYKDTLAFSLSLLVVVVFAVFRRHIHVQRRAWLRLCILTLAAAGMLVLLRRWNIFWAGLASALLFSILSLRSKTISQGISREDIIPVAVVAASILLTISLKEGVLRLFPSILPPGAQLRIQWSEEIPWLVAHPYVGYLHGTRTNLSKRTARSGMQSQGRQDVWGFRNFWPWPAKVDIIAVGDSFTYGYNVNDDQTWTTLLERTLRNRVLNLGLIGAAPQQYLRIYETFGIERAPKVLLVGLFLGNDFGDARRFDLWWKSGGKGSFADFGKPETKPGIRGWLDRWVRKTYIFALIRDFLEAYKSGRLLASDRVDLPGGGRLQLVPSFLDWAAKSARPEDPGFLITLKTLESIHELASRHKTHAVVLLIPSKEEIYFPLLGEEAVDLAASLIPELESQGIPYIHLALYFRQRAAAGEELYFEVDGHTNARGNALIAETVLSHLKENAQRYGLKYWERDFSRAGPVMKSSRSRARIHNEKSVHDYAATISPRDRVRLQAVSSP